MSKVILALASGLALVAVPVLAQSNPHADMQHGMMMKNTPANPYAEAEMQMNHRMMSAIGADATETWVRKMIEHHRGAIEMSKILEAKSSDAQAKAMARKAVAEQERGIAELEQWLKRHGKRPQ